MANVIKVYQGNTLTINCTVTGIASLTGYTGTFTLKKNASDAVALASEAHDSINGLVVTFVLPSSVFTVDAGNYVFDITITDGTNIFTISQDKIQITESVKY